MANHQKDTWNPGSGVNPIKLGRVSRFNPSISHQHLWWSDSQFFEKTTMM